ncbi:MAG: hypothetical protein RQ751_01085 [Longimicrobiales bacterium]|nr:hypothetical protein [Longimicrobiales bacterium]
MRRYLSVCAAHLLALTLLLAPGLGAQQRDLADTRFLETRAELEALLGELRETAASTAYSAALRRRARDEANVIERRLQEGDFGVNDRIFLAVSVQGQPWFADTLRVFAGPAVRFVDLGDISLHGVLRSELGDHMATSLGRFLREPRVLEAESFVRLTFLGAVGGQGERHLPAASTLGEVLTQAGLGATSDFEGVTISRGGELLWSQDAVMEAVRRGRTLDQMSLQAGDEILIPAQQPPNRTLTLLQIGLGLLTSVVLITQVF